MGKIILVLLSKINKHILEVLKQGIEKTFDRTVETRVKVRSLDYTYDSSRNQYISPRLLSRLRRIKKDYRDKILGIVDVDLYSPEFDFIFGEAEINSGVATVSLHRLLPEGYGLYPDSKVFEERAVKEAVHELGHLYHLDHCANPECVMHFSTSLVDVDMKGKSFCSKCQQKLK
jgi:archaemetzincin